MAQPPWSLPRKSVGLLSLRSLPHLHMALGSRGREDAGGPRWASPLALAAWLWRLPPPRPPPACASQTQGLPASPARTGVGAGTPPPGRLPATQIRAHGESCPRPIGPQSPRQPQSYLSSPRAPDPQGMVPRTQSVMPSPFWLSCSVCTHGLRSYYVPDPGETTVNEAGRMSALTDLTSSWGAGWRGNKPRTASAKGGADRR